MTVSPWQRRIKRAQELAEEHAFAAEMLEFYIHIARFQQDLHRHLSMGLPQSSAAGISRDLSEKELSTLSSRFEPFLSLAEAHGPEQLAEVSRRLRVRGSTFWTELLRGSWTANAPSDASGFLAVAFLQPYAELLRSRLTPQAREYTYALCAFCNRKPAFGVLRQMGDGAARSLVCGFCLGEWTFRRIVCPGCGEENNQKLPVFTAAEFEYIRVECCDACKTYIKTVDLTKNGRAEPIVDELAAAPLDVWALDRGYAKLQSNILGM